VVASLDFKQDPRHSNGDVQLSPEARSGAHVKPMHAAPGSHASSHDSPIFAYEPATHLPSLQ
jgi:hypothetical protein